MSAVGNVRVIPSALEAMAERFRETWGEEFELPDQAGLFNEVGRMLAACKLKNTEFRSNHASNYLVLKGRLNEDRERLLAQIHDALEDPQGAGLRQEWQRGL